MIYVRHRRYGQSLGFLYLKETTDCRLFIWVGTSSQIFVCKMGLCFGAICNWPYRSRMKCSCISGVIWKVIIQGKDILHYIRWKFIHYLHNLQESVYFCDALKRNYQFLEALHMMMYFHGKPYEDTVHAFYWFCY